jgi:hypothetical protein
MGFVFDNAINSRSAFMDHMPLRPILLATMLSPAHSTAVAQRGQLDTQTPPDQMVPVAPRPGGGEFNLGPWTTASPLDP